jgi:branched-subunit amino acid ABC-type transport system permease component
VELFQQQLANGIASGAIIAMLSIGYALIFGTMREFHFAYGSIYMLAAWVLYIGGTLWALPCAAAVVISIAAATTLGVATERFLYAPLRPRSNRHVGVIMTGLGLALVIDNVVYIISGTTIKYLDSPIAGSINYGTTYLTKAQIAGILIAPVCLGATLAFLRLTSLGRSIRAVSADPELSYTVGIRADVVRMWVYAIGTAISAIAASIVALDVGFSVPMGLNAVLLATVAVIVGGIGSVVGAALAGFILGIAQNAGYLGINLQWQSSIAFGALMLIILFRPTGIVQSR